MMIITFVCGSALFILSIVCFNNRKQIGKELHLLFKDIYSEKKKLILCIFVKEIGKFIVLWKLQCEMHLLSLKLCTIFYSIIVYTVLFLPCISD